MRYKLSFGLALAIAAAGFGMAAARTIPLVGNFSPENGTRTVPIGMVKGTLNTTSRILTYRITYSGLSGQVMAADFQGPAAPGKEAGVLLAIPGPYHSGLARKRTVSASEARTILAGETYINLLTEAEPNGEARAQVNAE